MINQKILEDIVDETRYLLGQGKVADYIPALSKVDSNKLGVALYTKENEVFGVGDYKEPFSIQSISKLFALIQALTLYDEEDIWKRVKKEPSGQAFNSIVLLEFEKGIPRNPFINAGALVISDMLQSKLPEPQSKMLSLCRDMAFNQSIEADLEIAESEYNYSSRNASIAHLMKSFGNFDNEVDQVLKNYFYACSIKMSCLDLAKAFFCLMNNGQDIKNNQYLTSLQSKKINALLMMCGLYDGAGDFAYRVGMPGKSGVGGGIFAVLPNKMSICVWSPELDKVGNSLVGTMILQKISELLGHSVF